MSKLVIAYISLDADRRDIERIEGQTFESLEALKNAIGHDAIIMSLGEHTTRLNDEEYTEGEWVAYFYIN